MAAGGLLGNAHLLKNKCLLCCSAFLLVLFVALIVGRPCFPAAKYGPECDISCAAAIQSPRLPHVLDSLFHLWLLPSSDRFRPRFNLRKVVNLSNYVWIPQAQYAV